MGCGGSSTFNEDGSVIPGKGETKIEWQADKPVEVGFYYYNDKDAEILVKEFPMDKECTEKVFEKTNVVSSNGGMHWIKVVPGTRYAMKYTEGGHSVAFPNQKVLDLPKKIHEFHTKDDAAKDKLVTDLKKDVEKEEGHAYNAEGSDDKIKGDIDALGGYNCTAEFPDEMAAFKKACVNVEDLQPWSTISPVLGIKTEFGHWEVKDGKLARQLGMADKIKIKGEEEVAKKGPNVPHMGLSKVQGVFKGVVEGAVKGGCKKAGPEVEVLAPGLSARIDNMDCCVPGVARVAERTIPAAKEGEAPAEEEKKEGDAPAEEEGDPIEKAGKAEYEADKGNLDSLKGDDAKDYKGEAEDYLKKTFGSIQNVEAAANDDTAVIANFEGFQNPAFVTGVDGDNATVQWARNAWQDEAAGTVPKQTDASAIDGKAASDSKLDAFTSLPEASDDWLERGRAVMIRNGREFNQGWVKSVDGDDVNVEDAFLVNSKVKKTDVFTHLTQQHIATRGVAIVPNFAPMKFWWTCAEDPNVTVRKVKVWRFGAPETAETYDLTAQKAKAKPSKENKEPQGEVHIGYSADVPILLGAKYAYNFQIGEEYFVDFEAKVSDAEGCKVFTSQARVEYA